MKAKTKWTGFAMPPLAHSSFEESLKRFERVASKALAKKKRKVNK